jgi:hypothetical protein
MKERNTISLSETVGQIVRINPQALVNRKRLYTIQGGIDMKKLMNALQGKANIEDDLPKGWVDERNGYSIYILGDGNHRVGLACIKREEIPLYIQGVWQGDKNLIGFNAIIQKIKSELGGSSNIY